MEERPGRTRGDEKRGRVEKLGVFLCTSCSMYL